MKKFETIFCYSIWVQAGNNNNMRRVSLFTRLDRTGLDWTLQKHQK